MSLHNNRSSGAYATLPSLKRIGDAGVPPRRVYLDRTMPSDYYDERPDKPSNVSKAISDQYFGAVMPRFEEI
jgi:hypothetical protein